MRILLILLVFIQPLSGVEKLPEAYRICYGNPEAKIQITEYFSFLCPSCRILFCQEFQEIKETYLQNGEIYWEFHPVPLDMATLQAMVCLEKLSEQEKRVFLEVILEETDSVPFMKKAMEVFGSPIPELDNKEYLIQTDAFQKAFAFIQQEDLISAVPAVSINGVLYPEEVPNISFIRKTIEGDP